MAQVNKEKMNEIFGNIEKTSIVGILVHPSPDPDALGAAAGFSILLKKTYGLNSKIFYLGTISHPQNKSLKNVLHILLEDGKGFDPESVGAIVVLDTDLVGTGLKDDRLIKADIRIDHHTMNRDEEVILKDVRLVGSTCSIVWEYLKEFNIELNEFADAATAMVLGIKTDTQDFTMANTTELDMEAFRALLPYADKTSLAKVTKFPLPKYYFETETRAFKEKDIKNTTLITFVGEVTPHNRDVIPTIADRFVRMDGISTAIIMGIIDNSVVASIRSTDSRVDVDDLCSNTFGRAHAGGKEGSGGASFPLGKGFEFLEGKKTREAAVEEVINHIKVKLFEVLGEKTEEEEETK
jgi:nanoRNase/pAp phosphatase (c-di-AMP/oligoRNAs hydrolase)